MRNLESAICRHIRLTYLLPELLHAVDTDTVPFMAGFNLSLLTEKNQQTVLDWLKGNGFQISVNQSKRICKMANDVDLTLKGLRYMFAPMSDLAAPAQIQTFSIKRKQWKEYDELLPQDNAGFEELFKQFLDWLRKNQSAACKNGGGGVE